MLNETFDFELSIGADSIIIFIDLLQHESRSWKSPVH